MEVVAQTQTTAAQAMSLARKIAASMVTIMLDPAEDTYYLRDGRYRKDRTVMESSGDWTGAYFGLQAVPGGLEFYGWTCGGHFHALRIYRDGRIEADQTGARNSSGSSLLESHLPDEWWELRPGLEWELTTYNTSRPDWAVTIALVGNQRFCGYRSDSPTCLWEEDAQNQKRDSQIWESDEYQAIPSGGTMGMAKSHAA